MESSQKSPKPVRKQSKKALVGAAERIEIEGRPSKIKIFNKVYEVRFVPNSKGMHDYGIINTDAAQIQIRDRQPILDEVDTVLHEVVHGIDLALTLGLTELQVHNIASGLMSVFQDNPRFAEYVVKPRLEKIEGL